MTTATFDPVKFKEATRQQWQKVAEGWHKWAPFIGEWSAPVTELMLDFADVGPGSRVLDVAAGDGNQSLAAARRVGPGGFVLATDIAPNLVAYAVEMAREAGLDNIEARAMDGENLELEDETFDAVISRFGLMFFPDAHRGLSEMHRVLKPGGRKAAIVFSTPDKSPWFSLSAMIARRHAGLPAPGPGQPGPFSLGGPGVLEGAIRKAGYREVKTQVLSMPLRMASSSECVGMLQEAAGPLHQMLAGLEESARQEAWREIAQELSKFDTPTGFDCPTEVIVGAGLK